MQALRRAWGFSLAVTRRFLSDRCLMQASALAYTSALSLVPLLALMFAVLKGLGVQHRLEPILLSRLALSPEVTERVITYIDRTNVATLGALGAAALVLTVLSVLGQIESSLNDIWRVRRSRTWWRKATDYLGVVLLTPFLLLAAVAATSAVKEQALLARLLRTDYVGHALLRTLYLAPFVINIAILAILYASMPNRRPFLPGIAFGAVIAGCAWQLVQWTYIALGVGVARYSAIYGAISQVPITLAWIYVSWSVVLAGAELAAAFEFGTAHLERAPHAASQPAIGLHILLRAAEAFRGGGTGVDLRAIARELQVGMGAAHAVVEQLCERRLLAPLADSDTRFILARDARSIALDCLDDLATAELEPSGCDPRVVAALDAARQQQHAALQGQRLADLLDTEAADQPPAATPGRGR